MDNSNQSPQPSQPPMAPPQPSQVPPASGPPNYQMPPKKRLSRGAFWGIIGGAITLLVAIVGVVLAVVFLGGITQKDFQEAQAQAKTVANSYRDLESKFTTYSRSLTQSTSGSTGPENVTKSLTIYKRDVAKLEGMKAFRDEETRKLYDAYVSRNTKFVSFIESYVASDSVMRTVGKDCSSGILSTAQSTDSSKLADAYKEAAAPCVKSLESLSEVGNEILANYAKQLLPIYAEQQKLFEQMQDAYNAKDSSAYYSAVSKIKSQSSDFLKAVQDLTAKAKEMEVADQLNDLGKHLTNRANGKK